MLTTTSVSDVEHNSDDHHDVKDLSFRGGSNNAAQAPIVGSSTNANGAIHHMDTSDYDSTRSPTTSSGTTSTTSIRMTTANIGHHLNNLSPPHAHENALQSGRMRKLSENSTDVEHCNNNYKFKNYIQQRFTHETYHSEESMQSNQCATEHDKEHHHETNNNTVKKSPEVSTKINGVHHDIKNEVLVSNSPSPAAQQQQQTAQPAHLSTRVNGKLTNGTVNGSSQHMSHHSIPIPVFACHTQGFYVPLNVEYDLLLPFLGGIDLLNKNFNHLPPLHPISINVNYTPALIKNAIASAANHFIKPKVENGINGW
jgi:FKBP-type peptidyl-prolyl cis-trans isomerase